MNTPDGSRKNTPLITETQPSSHVSTASTPATANSNNHALKHGFWKRLKHVFFPPEGGLKEALEDVLEDIDEGEVDASDEERSILSNMVNFATLKVSDVMVPRSDIAAFDIEVSLEKIRSNLLENKYSRFPVYEESLDTIAGYIHTKDVVMFLGQDTPAYNIRSLLRPIIFAAPSMRVMDLLVQMRQSSCHIAVVVDEYGGIDGLVTMEDVCEELVGDIQDEHHVEEYHLNHINDHIIEADARIPVEELSAAMQMSLLDANDDDVDTISGLIISVLGRIPARGEVVMLSAGIKAEILNADPRRIHKVRITQEREIALQGNTTSA